MKTFLATIAGITFLLSASTAASACDRDRRCGQVTYQQPTYTQAYYSQPSYPQAYYTQPSYPQAVVPAAPQVVPTAPQVLTPPQPPTPPVLTAPQVPSTNVSGQPSAKPAEMSEEVKALIREAVERALAEERARNAQSGSGRGSQSSNRDSSDTRPVTPMKSSPNIVVARPSISNGDRP